MTEKCQKEAETKRDGVIIPQNYNFHNFKFGKYDALLTLRIKRRTWLHVPKETEAKRDGVINPQNYNFHNFKYRKFDALQTLRINLSQP